MSKAEQIIASMNSRLTTVEKAVKVLPLRDRNVDFSMGKKGVLKRVMANRFVKNKYTHIRLQGITHSVSVTKGMWSPIVWIE